MMRTLLLLKRPVHAGFFSPQYGHQLIFRPQKRACSSQSSSTSHPPRTPDNVGDGLAKHPVQSSRGPSKGRGRLKGHKRIPDTPCRTRFAPSPTGYLHLGSLRTALFNYLLAKTTNGQFILRLEDTDQSRLVPDAEQRLYEDLSWAGLTWDEGPNIGGPYGPYRQSERLDIYNGYAEKLVRERKAYRCFCDPAEMDTFLRSQADIDSPISARPNPCIALTLAESEERAARGDQHAIMFKTSATPHTVKDIVYGHFRKRLPEPHFVIRKRDGFPTYHFANVVDDHLMGITHVVRGAEWLVSTPKHAQLYAALGWNEPRFAHVGLLVDEQGQKLSKRAPGVGISWYRDQDIFPTALLNFAVLLGWHPTSTRKSEEMTLQEMIEEFHLGFTKGDITVSLPGKLEYFQQKEKLKIIHEDSPDMASVYTHFIAPLEATIYDLISGQEQGASDGIAASSPLVLRPVAAAGHSAEDKKIVNPEFLVRLLLSHRHSTGTKSDSVSKIYLTDSKRTVSDHKYIIFELPKSILADRIREGVLPRYWAEGEVQAYSSAYEFLMTAKRELEGLGEDIWVDDGTNLKTKLNGILAQSSPDALHNERQRCSTFFWAVLRWSLLGSESGISDIHAMRLLGREETLKRLETAAEVARRAMSEAESRAPSQSP